MIMSEDQFLDFIVDRQPNCPSIFIGSLLVALIIKKNSKKFKINVMGTVTLNILKHCLVFLTFLTSTTVRSLNSWQLSRIEMHEGNANDDF